MEDMNRHPTRLDYGLMFIVYLVGCLIFFMTFYSLIEFITGYYWPWEILATLTIGSTVSAFMGWGLVG